ncbi:MAG: hypothetical protein ACRENL_05620, partial [Candidatus Dormibacteria bacterium]
LGQRYGDAVIVSDALYLLFGGAFRFGFSGKHTCSGSVAHALELDGYDLGDDEEWNSPADDFAVASKWQEVSP